MTKKKPEQFEDALKKLEKIVEKLEHGNLPLEEAMEAFTEGSPTKPVSARPDRPKRW